MASIKIFTRLKNLTLSFTLIAVGSGFASTSDASSQCSFLFVPLLSLREASQNPTVELSQTLPNLDGETFFSIRKRAPELPWLSLHARHRYDTQYDPTWPLHYLGPDLAVVMGYSFAANGELRAPTADTYNRRIQLFNAFLAKQGIEAIPVRFYRQPNATIESFLRHWMTDFGIPIADSMDGHTVHDISGHAAGLAISIPVLRLIQAEAGLAWHYLKFKNATVTPKVVRHIVGDVDSLSAAANIPHSDERSMRAVTQARQIFDLLTHPFDSPPIAVRNSAIDIFAKRLATYGSGETRETRDQFVEQMRKQHPEWDRPLAELGIAYPAAIYNLQAERSIKLRKAAHDFLKSQKEVLKP